MASEQVVLADRLTLVRARVASVLGALFLASMATSFTVDIGDSRPAMIQISAWVVWAVALLFLVAVGGGLFKGASVRSMMNDDNTIENRRSALVIGFWSIVLCAFLLYGISFFEEIAARQAIRLLISVGVGAAAIRFGALERRALQVG